ncbi:hypothetical protein VTK73DRAFT_9523 [Phialemonium thermophilum]|uniref:Sodium/calcium exchanger membrane region domain-containing protein n=1 Tax=Phialemonium thermophilum TaxID=223376 RepID=A0ABR3Y4E1_9PEZI
MMSCQYRRRNRSWRPFCSIAALALLITTYALLLRTHSASSHHVASRLQKRFSKEECRDVHHAEDKCAFVVARCTDEEAGLLPYLTFYYCTFGSVQPMAFLLMAAWLGLLFTTIGIAASDFFSVNLSTIATILGLSESLAGVTFLAFGNGSPDVFSTFAAMGSNSGSMAIGELVGAAGFITAVVAGSMALVREFKVSRKTFVRDICFFIVAISFTMVFLADGELHLWECCAMISYYFFYVFVVVGWHWLSARKKRKRVAETVSRGHFYGTSGHGADELEPYRDDDDDDDDTAPMGRRQDAIDTADISALERASLLESNHHATQARGDDEDTGVMHVAAEMASSMRITRPRWGRSNSTITPIRPSLVGALEFRSVISSLQRARNMHMATIPERSSSAGRLAAEPVTFSGQRDEGPRRNSLDGRDRALSSGHTPRNLSNPGLPNPKLVPISSAAPSQSESPTSAAADGLAPSVERAKANSHSIGTPSSSLVPQVHVTGVPETSSARTSPSLSPFPLLSVPGSPSDGQRHEHAGALALPHSSLRRRSSFPGIGFDEDEQLPKPVKWWPYKFLPAPHILWQTLFPTLQGWRDKSVWDKIVSVISAPSVFVLVITLPVVETEDQSDDPVGDGSIDTRGFTEPGMGVADVAVEQDAVAEPQNLRGRAMPPASGPQGPLSPDLSVYETLQVNGQPDPSSIPGAMDNRRHRQSSVGVPRSTGSVEENSEWQRWLVGLQIFTGPLFVVCIVWANMRGDMDQPNRALIRLVLCSLVLSLVMLAILLTTSPVKKPKYQTVLCFLGFVISIAWISTVAGEVVGVLKAFGVILGISDAILGLTIFAVGNSLGDLVADVTVARLGYPVMALSACFGGPMLNILLGVGIGGAWMVMRSANREHERNPNQPLRYEPYHIQVGGTLLISAITVLLTLVVLLITVPSNRWLMSRKIGWCLIIIWAIGTLINLGVELAGVWSDVS